MARKWEVLEKKNPAKTSDRDWEVMEDPISTKPEISGTSEKKSWYQESIDSAKANIASETERFSRGEVFTKKPQDALEKTLKAASLPVGAVELGIQGVGGLGQAVGQGIGAIIGGISGEGMTEGARKGAEFMDRFVYQPRSQAGQAMSGAFGAGLHAAAESLGSAAPEVVKAIPFFDELPKDVQTAVEATAHGLGKSIPEAAMIILGFRGAKAQLESLKQAKLSKERAAEAAEALKKKLEQAAIEKQKAEALEKNVRTQEELLNDPARLGLDEAWQEALREVDAMQKEILTNPESVELGAVRGKTVPEAGPEFSTPKSFFPHQGEIPMQGSRGGGILNPALRQRLEQELNPPVEQRVPGQGELPFPENVLRQDALTPEQTQRQSYPYVAPPFELGEIVTSAREQTGREFAETWRETDNRRTQELGDRNLTRENQFRDPEQVTGRDLPDQRAAREPLPYEKTPIELELEFGKTQAERGLDLKDTPITERGSVGERIEARRRLADEERARGKIETLPYEKVLEEQIKRNEKDLELIQQPSLFERWQGWKKRNSAQSIRIGGKQGGVIHPDLLTFGTARVWEKLSREFSDTRRAAGELLRKFEGTFEKFNLDGLIARASRPDSRDTVALMSPDEYHNLAYPRTFKAPVYIAFSESKRRSVEQGLKTPSGLHDIPILLVILENGQAKVFRHDGRHRMDIFKKQGMDLIPVIIRNAASHNFEGWGNLKSVPDRILSEDGSHYGKFPNSIFFPKETIPHPSTRSTPYVPRSQRGHIGDWPERVAETTKKAGPVASVLEQKRMLLEERRPLKEVLEESPIDPKTVEDIGGYSQFVNTTVDQTMAILSRTRIGVGKIVNWVVDHRNRISRERDIFIRDNVLKILDPLRILYKNFRLDQRIYQDVKEMMTIWMNSVGKEPLQRHNFKNDAQWERFQAAHKVLQDVLFRVNQARASIGKDPIPILNNYFPAIWKGDYRIWIKDQAGDNVGVYAFSNMIEATFAHKFFTKEHPNLVVEKPTHASLNKKIDNYNDFSAFETAMRINARDHQATKLLQETYSRLLIQKGYGRHGLIRQNLFGFLGMDRKGVGVENGKLALELYVKRAANHIHNIEISKLGKELHETLPIEVQAKMPKAMEYMEKYLAKSRGVDLSGLTFLDKIFEEGGKKIGFGETASTRTLQNVSTIASLWKLLTVKFLLGATPLQPTIILAKLKQLNLRLPETENWAKSFYKGYQDAIWQTPYTKELLAWANKNEHLESSIVSLMGLKRQDLRAEKNLVTDTGRFVLSGIEKATVRIPTLLAFDHALKKAIPEKEARWQASAKLLYHIVNYSRESSPLVYDKMGIVGEAARPMKQYAHNYFGQFLEYLQGATNKGEFSPLAMFVGNQALIAGLRGTILIAEATAIITLINSITGKDYPTPEQAMLKNGASDALVFGVPSTLLGVDVSSSVNSPSIPQAFGFFPVEVGASVVKASWDYLHGLATGTLTDEKELAAAIELFPSAMRGWWEELYRKEGMPVPKPTMGMQGTYVRSEGEAFVAQAFSLKSLDEARADLLMRTAKQLLVQSANRKLSAIEVMADRVINNEPLDNEIIMRYIQEGGNPKLLARTIKERIINRNLTWEEQQMRGSITPDKLKRLDIIKGELDRKMLEKMEEEQDNPIKKQSNDGASGQMKDSQVDFNDLMLGYSAQERLEIYRRARQKGVTLPPIEQIREDERLRKEAVRNKHRKKVI